MIDKLQPGTVVINKKGSPQVVGRIRKYEGEGFYSVVWYVPFGPIVRIISEEDLVITGS